MENITVDFSSIDLFNATQCREYGMLIFKNRALSLEEKKQGIQLVIRAAKMGDLEAKYLYGLWLLNGTIQSKEADSLAVGLKFMCAAARGGYRPARLYLDHVCEKRYEAGKDRSKMHYRGRLVGFDDKPIKVKCKGAFTPVDAVLEYTNGENILTLSVNIVLSEAGVVSCDMDKLRKAVYDGILAWEGEYEVFGGQRLTVKINLTEELRIYDNVIVLPMTKEMTELFSNLVGRIGTKEVRSRGKKLIEQKRSFATIGVHRWSKHSRKIISLQSKDFSFDNYEEIKHVTKHEFGHVLGLGDLYFSPMDQLQGVEKGSFRELDSYCIDDKDYNLVMCDHHGPISNNDIEMVILAFSKNKMQNYQVKSLHEQLSEALGKGN